MYPTIASVLGPQNMFDKFSNSLLYRMKSLVGKTRHVRSLVETKFYHVS